LICKCIIKIVNNVNYYTKKFFYTLDNPINNDSAQYYNHNLNNTLYCDQFSNLKTLRYDMYVVDNINKLNNPYVTQQAVIHYRFLHRKALIHSLSYYNRYKYYYANFKLEFHRIYN